MPRHRTPIERFIDDAVAPDRRARWEASKLASGYVRCTLRVHRDDEAALKAYAASLLSARQPPDAGR